MKTKGWLNVLKFTYVQTIKSKAFIVSTVLMLVFMILMLAGTNFLPKMIDSSKADDDMPKRDVIEIKDEEGNVIGKQEKLPIKKIYIFNNTELDIDYDFLDKLEIEHETIDKTEKESLTEGISESTEPETVLTIEESGNGYDLEMSRPEKEDLLKDDDCYDALKLFRERINSLHLQSLGVKEEDVDKTNIYISTSVKIGNKEPKSPIVDMLIMAITIITSVVLFMLIIGYGQLTAQAIATEKSSRVMELLLTSVKPLAVIIGKVLATTLVVLTVVLGIGGISAALFFIVAPFGLLGEISGMVDTTDEQIQGIAVELGNAFAGFTIPNIVLILFVFLLGFLFYSLISGLIGASVSKIEDLQTALQPLVWIAVLGFYLTYFSAFAGIDTKDGDNFLVTLSRYLPISSPFALPGAILSKQMSMGQISIAIGVLAVCLILFAIFVAKVYEHIILNNGNRVKIKDMIKLAKKSKES